MSNSELGNIYAKSNTKSDYKKLILTASKMVIALGLLIYLLMTIDLNEIINSLKRANLFFIAAAILLGLLNLYIQFFKWKLTSNILLQENRDSKIWRSLFYGFSAGIFTPARVGEYFGRAIAFSDKPLLKVAMATLIDKFFTLLIVAALGSVASIFFVNFYYNAAFYITFALFILVFTLFYFIIFLIFNDWFWENALFKLLKNSAKLNVVYNKVKAFRNLDRKYSIRMIFISVLFYSCFLIQYSFLVSAFSNHYNFWGYLWAGNLIMFVKTIIPPISIGELGIREGASIYFITYFKETISTGFNASIFLFFINVLLPSIIGLVLLLKKNDD
jgi:uncharacterized protein (TIRG00374 family)